MQAGQVSSVGSNPGLSGQLYGAQSLHVDGYISQSCHLNGNRVAYWVGEEEEEKGGEQTSTCTSMHDIG